MKINNYNLIKTRLKNQGGAAQQDRMIKDKKRTLDKVVLYSYHGAQVQRPEDLEPARALINPNQLKQDYDDKVLSIGYEYGYKPGDIFEWLNTGTKWLIYLQDLTELAYFRGDIRKCSYEISWEDAAGERHVTYAAVRGPQENSISSIARERFNIDIPNYTLHLLLPRTPEVTEQFQRYAKFYLKDIDSTNKEICWRVEATDDISMPGILEVYAEEYYSNTQEDDVEQGIVGGLVEEPVAKPSLIKGEQFIKPKKTYHYYYEGAEEGEWSVQDWLHAPIEYEETGKELTLKWNATYSGQFTIGYGEETVMITVESLF